MKHTKQSEVTYRLRTLPELKPQYAGTSKLFFNIPSISKQSIEHIDYGISILASDDESVTESSTETKK